MFGKITYQGEAGYAERLLADENGVMLTVCTSFDVVKLYRLDYTLDGYPTNLAVYDLMAAIHQFQGIVEKQSASTSVGTTFTDQNGLTVQHGAMYGIDGNGDLYDLEPLAPIKPSEY